LIAAFFPFTPNPSSVSAGDTATIGVHGGEGPPALEFPVAPLSLNLSSGSGPVAQGLQIRNTGSGELLVSIEPSTQAGGAWLSVTPREGVVTAAEPLAVSVEADPAGLGAGTFFGSLNITSDLESANQESSVVPISLAISSRRQLLRLSLKGLTFTAVQAGGNSPALAFDVINDGPEAMPFTAAVAAIPNAPWLQLSSTAGTVDPNARTTVSVDVNPGSLAAGVHFGVIEVQASKAAGEVRLLTVVLNLLAAGSRPPPVVDPAGILFVGTVSK
jgi:hypothetical protein